MEDENWRNFFQKVSSLLSSYEIQKDTTLYNVRNFDDWGKKNKSQGVRLWNAMPKFFSALQNNHNIDVSKVNTSEIHNAAFSYGQLNDLFGRTLRRKPSTWCPKEQKLHVEGDFVKLSTVSLDYCKIYYANETIKTLQIFARDTVFIDADFVYTDPGFSMVIAAPKWEIIGTRTIKLNGEDGSDLGILTAEPGFDGRPGLPGKPGGNFLGLAQVVKNGQNLTITSNGGRGGKGQDGGDGLPGRNGSAATTNYFDYLQREKIGGNRWRIYGETGKKGGRGGNGGKGGFGGSPGQVKLFDLSNAGVIVENGQGDEGSSGKGGRGGMGGHNGNNLEATYIICCWSSEKEVTNDKSGPEGETGIDGRNDHGRMKPEEVENDFRNILVKYKMFLREYITHKPYRQNEIAEFLTQLDLDDQVLAFLTVEGILDDYLELEEKFRDYSTEHIEMFRFYEILLTVVEKQSHLDHSRDDKIVLLYLYTTLLTKLDILHENIATTALVVKIKDYLDVKIHIFRDWQRYGAGRNVLFTFDANGRDIDDLSKEVHSFIEKHIKTSKVGNLLDSLAVLSSNLTEITMKTDHLSEFLILEDAPEIKVPKKEISSVKSIISKIDLGEERNALEGLLGKLLTQIIEDIDDFEKKLKSNRLTSLDITKWKIPDVLKGVKYHLKNLPQRDKLTLEGLNQMISLYQRVENLYQLKKLSHYLGHMDSKDWTTEIKNETLSKKVAKLKQHAIANAIISEYENNVAMTRQYAFPYMDKIAQRCKLPRSLISDSDNSTALLYRCIDYTEDLKNALFRDVSIFGQRMTYSVYDYRQPFFIWGEEYESTLQKLFSGEEVLLEANPEDDMRNGVHFDWIEIQFKAREEPHQELIDRKLNNYHVELNHWGNSHYKCGNKTYLITTSPVSLYYSQARSKKGEPDRLTQNAVYSKIVEGDKILSPYAMWTLKLVKNHHVRGIDIANMHNFHKLTDLQLVGRHNYFYDCDQKTVDFYDQEEPFPLPKILETKRKRRSAQISTNAGSTISSPINNLFKWISSNFAQVAKIDYLSSFATGSVEGRPDTTLNPVTFFHHVDSLLVLAPFLICLTMSRFRGTKSKDEKKEEKIGRSRIKLWKHFLQTFRNILERYDLKVTWILTSLEDREDEIANVKNTKDAEDVEKAMVALLVDFVEEVQENHVKVEVNFIKDFSKLIDVAESIPDFGQKLVY